MLLLASLIGQSFAGLHQFNAEALEHDSETYTWFRYVTSSEFGGDVLENWHSLGLAMLFCFVGSWLTQSLTNWRAFNRDQLDHDGSTIGWGEYWASAVEQESPKLAV